MICTVCTHDLPATMKCGTCRAQVCRGCKVSPNPSDKAFALCFGAFCSTDCRDGQEVHAALASIVCPQCNGTPPPRSVHLAHWQSSCGRCRDTGIVFPKAEEDTPEKRTRADFRKRYPCPVCAGVWQANTSTCLTCEGVGMNPEHAEELAAAINLRATRVVGDDLF